MKAIKQVERRTTRTVALFAVAAALMVMAATAFGGSSGSGSAAAAENKDIVDTAVAAGKFKTLASLLEQAGLVETLKGEGPYTVFAPTDAAFAKVPKPTLEALGKDKEKLRAVLLYHVAQGKLTASKVVKRRSVKTLNGQSVRVRVRHKKVTINAARVLTPDVIASNGVIHVINKVLIPR